MSFEPKLFPYEFDQFPHWLTEEQLKTHYEKNYINYINKLNELVKNKDIRSEPILQLMFSYQINSDIFNNASQVINHEFFWDCISPYRSTINNDLLDSIILMFGSFDNFKKLFNTKSSEHFGSGWTWLLLDSRTYLLKIIVTDNAYNPFRDGLIPLLVLDLWEHAYFLQYKTDRKSYVENFWNYINWNTVNLQYLSVLENKN